MNEEKNLPTLEELKAFTYTLQDVNDWLEGEDRALRVMLDEPNKEVKVYWYDFDQDTEFLFKTYPINETWADAYDGETPDIEVILRNIVYSLSFINVAIALESALAGKKEGVIYHLCAYGLCAVYQPEAVYKLLHGEGRS